MLKRPMHGAALVMTIAASALWINAQSNYSPPRAFNLDPIVRRTFKSFYKRWYPGGPMQELMADRFFPLGWSRDGKFAYYVEPVDEACGCYFAELVIMDLRTDKELYHFKNDPEARVDKDGAPLEDDIRKLWKRNAKVFNEKLREHGIVPTGFALMPVTFSSTGKRFTAKLTKVKGKDGDGGIRVKKISLELISPGLGTKSLYSEEYKGEDDYSAPLDAAVIGAFRSPYENRVAVVMLNVQRGWEGPPHTVSVQIAGADLMRGFRKR